MKHCTDDDLIDYLHGELDDADDAAMHAHLERCGDCTARFDAEAVVGDLLRSSSLAQERELPPLIRANVWAAIRDAEPTLLEKIRAFVNPAAAVPLAVGLAMLMYFGVPVVRGGLGGAAPTVTAAYYLDEHAAQGQENPLADHMPTNAELAETSAGSVASSPLIGAADAATLDDLVASRR